MKVGIPIAQEQLSARDTAWFLHADRQTLALTLAQRLESSVRSALAERGQALLALAGGSTPLPAYRQFAEAALEWDAVTIIPTDERWVSDEHSASNLAQMRATLAAARGIRWCALKPRSLSPDASAHRACRMLARVPQAFDLVLLGMGSDAHTASLFPGATELPEALNPLGLSDAMALHPDPLPAEAPFARISLTLSRLIRARRLLLAITGDQKRAVLEQALADPHPATPIAHVLRAARCPVELHWSP